ncbi:MAG TPA: hypothetical protein VEQ38_09515 [Verrucomicrobiae bacterium]|nr:hypothetical protein [Verrucomicrobiae bacterium]
MAAFATMQAAEQRVRALMEAKTIVQGHSCRLKDGTIAIRVQRFMSLTGALGSTTKTADGTNPSGAWDVLTDAAS